MPRYEDNGQKPSARGGALTVALADLPPPHPRPRWVARRKAQVVAAVEAGLLSLDEARKRYLLSAEEFSGWQRTLHQSGLKGLRVVAAKVKRGKNGLRRSGGSNAVPTAARNGERKDVPR